MNSSNLINGSNTLQQDVHLNEWEDVRVSVHILCSRLLHETHPLQTLYFYNFCIYMSSFYAHFINCLGGIN